MQHNKSVLQNAFSLEKDLPPERGHSFGRSVKQLCQLFLGVLEVAGNDFLASRTQLRTCVSRSERLRVRVIADCVEGVRDVRVGRDQVDQATDALKDSTVVQVCELVQHGEVATS
jgi:hypothetical protein